MLETQFVQTRREAQARVGTNCEGVFGAGASDQLIGGRVLPSSLDIAPSDKYTPRRGTLDIPGKQE